MTHQELIQNLKTLKLTSLIGQYAEMARLAESKNHTYEQFLLNITQIELQHRKENRTKTLIREAKFPLIKTQEAFDFNRISGLSVTEFQRLSQGQFLKDGTNIIFYGTFGVGKTHLITALGKTLCEKGVKVLFTTLHQLMNQLLQAQASLTLTNFFKKLDRYELLICDELGYLAQTKEGADLFFQLISERTERKSIAITTNLTFSEWDKVFLNPLNTAAAVDRIIHKCETYNIQGPSWRTEEAKKRKIDKKIDIQE